MTLNTRSKPKEKEKKVQDRREENINYQWNPWKRGWVLSKYWKKVEGEKRIQQNAG